MSQPQMDTELGALPNSWRVRPLGDLIDEAQYGISVKGADEGSCPILRMTNQVNGRISPQKLQYANVSAHDVEKFCVKRGDILFNRTNSFELVGRTAIFDLEGEFVFASYLIRVRTKPTELDPFFLNLCLNSSETQRRLKSIASRAVSQSNISATRLKGFPVPVPPLSEQRKIAAVLGLVQRAIEQQEGLIALTTELKRALLHKLFSEGLRGEAQKQTEIGPVPESWEVKTIRDLFKFSSGKSRPKDTEPVASVSKPFPVYGGNGILGYSGSFLLEQPTLLLGRVGEYCGCAHHTEGRAWISDNALYAKEILGDVDTLYAAEFFAYANLNQYSNRAGQPLITQGIISEVKIPLPPLDEQRAILEPVTLLERKLKLHETKRSVVTDLFRTLLHQLMTAQIRVNDLDVDEILAQPVAEIGDGVAPRAGALVREGQVVHN
jgi:type I restriction enzyme S subunit